MLIISQDFNGYPPFLYPPIPWHGALDLSKSKPRSILGDGVFGEIDAYSILFRDKQAVDVTEDSFRSDRIGIWQWKKYVF